MNYLLIVMLASVGFVNSLFIFVFFLFFNKGNHRANIFLGFFSLAIALKLSFFLVDNIPHEWTVYSVIICVIADMGYISFGPLLLFYVLSVLNNGNLSKKYLLFLIISISPVIAWQTQIRFVLPWNKQLYFLIFLVWTFILIRKHFKSSSQFLISEKKWLYIFWYAVAGVWLSINLLFIDWNFFVVELSVYIIFSIFLIVALWFKQRDFSISTESVKQPYSKSTMSDGEGDALINELKQLFEEKKIYRNADLTLPKVATLLNVSVHKLSQAINQKQGISFSEFVNKYRLEEVKNALLASENQNLKIAHLAYDYGFNSLSTFNTYFKKQTNFTPSQYREKFSVFSSN